MESYLPSGVTFDNETPAKSDTTEWNAAAILGLTER